MTKGLEELKNIRELFTCHDIDLLEKCNVIEKELKAPTNLINKELRNARKSLPYDDYRCGYIDALITIKNKIKEQGNEK